VIIIGTDGTHTANADISQRWARWPQAHLACYLSALRQRRRALLPAR
jgi:hypothetical protein